MFQHIGTLHSSERCILDAMFWKAWNLLAYSLTGITNRENTYTFKGWYIYKLWSSFRFKQFTRKYKLLHPDSYDPLFRANLLRSYFPRFRIQLFSRLNFEWIFLLHRFLFRHFLWEMLCVTWKLQFNRTEKI